MAYDLDRTIKYKCPCGEGLILEKCYSNDWNQRRTDYSIDCPTCGSVGMHVEEIGWFKNDGEYRTTPYLVPSGETLSYDSGGVSYLGDPFSELLCRWYTKSDLEHFSQASSTPAV